MGLVLLGGFRGVPPHTPQGSATPLTPNWRGEQSPFKQAAVLLEAL